MLRSETVRAAALGVPAQCGGRGSSCSLVTCQRPLGLEHVPALETRSPPPPPPRGQALPLPLRKSSWLLLLQWLLTTAWPSGPFLPSVSFCNTVTFGPLS